MIYTNNWQVYQSKIKLLNLKDEPSNQYKWIFEVQNILHKKQKWNVVLNIKVVKMHMSCDFA